MVLSGKDRNRVRVSLLKREIKMSQRELSALRKADTAIVRAAMVRAAPVLLFFLSTAIFLVAVRGDDSEAEVFDPDDPPQPSGDIDDLPQKPAEEATSSPPSAAASYSTPEAAPVSPSSAKPAESPPKPPESPHTRRTDMGRPSHLEVDLNFSKYGSWLSSKLIPRTVRVISEYRDKMMSFTLHFKAKTHLRRRYK